MWEACAAARRSIALRSAARPTPVPVVPVLPAALQSFPAEAGDASALSPLPLSLLLVARVENLTRHPLPSQQRPVNLARCLGSASVTATRGGLGLLGSILVLLVKLVELTTA